MARTPEERRTLAMTAIEAIGEGEYLRHVSQRLDVPASTILSWIDDDKDLLERYAHARTRGSIVRAEEMEDMAATSVGQPAEVVSAIKLQIDTRKWLLAKFARGVFGESSKIEHSGKVETSQVLDLSKYTDEDLETMRRLNEKGAIDTPPAQ
jgi:hypothetical protein